MRPNLRLPILLLLATTLGCAAHRPRAVPSEGGAPWHELKTDHFWIRTNVDADKVVAVAQRLEALRAAFVVALKVDPPTQVSVLHLRDQQSFEEFRPSEGLGGYATELVGVPFLVTVEDGFERATDHKTSIVAHELAHHFYSYLLARQPRWIADGLATYFETLNVRDGHAIIGQAPYWRYLKVREGVAPLESLLTWSHDLSGPQEAENYGQSWAWVHFLQTEHAERFAAFLTRLASAEEPREAFAATFAGVDLAALHRRVGEYVFETLPTREVVVPPVQLHQKARPLTDAEVHMVFAHLWHHTPSAETPERRAQEATRELRLALTKDPMLLEARLLAARSSEEAGRDAILAELERDFPDSVQVALHAAYDAKSRSDEAQYRKALDRAQRLGPEETDVLFELAELRLMEKKPDEAVALARKAFDRVPFRVEAAHELSVALGAAGRCKESAAFGQRALEMSAERASPEQWQRFAEGIAKRLAACVPKTRTDASEPIRVRPAPPLPKLKEAAPRPPKAEVAVPPAPRDALEPVQSPRAVTDRAWTRTAGWAFVGAGTGGAALSATLLGIGAGHHQRIRTASRADEIGEVWVAARNARSFYAAGTLVSALAAVSLGVGVYQLIWASTAPDAAFVSLGPGTVAIAGVFP